MREVLSELKKYEYKILSYIDDDFLNELGREGWLLCKVVVIPFTTSVEYIFIRGKTNG